MAPKKQQKTEKPTVSHSILLTPELMDRLCSLLRVGAYVEQACAQVGIEKSSFYNWMRRGAREVNRRTKYAEEIEREHIEDRTRRQKIRVEERVRRTKRGKDHVQTCEEEQRYVEFLNAIQRAQAEGEHAMLSMVSKAAAGGAVVRRTTRTASDGTTSTTEVHALPDWRAAAWRLEKRHPQRWGAARVDVHVEGEIATTSASPARTRLLAALARMAGAGDADIVDSEDDAEEADEPADDDGDSL